MIVWCRECDENWLQINGDWKDECSSCSKWQTNSYAFRAPVDEMLYGPYHVPEYFAPEPKPDPVKRALWLLQDASRLMDSLWAERTPRVEFNTVDLAELRRERKRQTFARTAQFLLSQQK